MNCYYLLKNQLDKIKDNYDFILIDTPPTLAIITQNALVASDSLIVPTQADSFCISGLADLKKQLEDIDFESGKIMSDADLYGVNYEYYYRMTIRAKQAIEFIITDQYDDIIQDMDDEYEK